MYSQASAPRSRFAKRLVYLNLMLASLRQFMSLSAKRKPDLRLVWVLIVLAVLMVFMGIMKTQRRDGPYKSTTNGVLYCQRARLSLGDLVVCHSREPAKD